MFRKEYVTYKYRKTPNIRPGLIKSYKHFLVGLYGTAFVPGVFDSHVTFVLVF